MYEGTEWVMGNLSIVHNNIKKEFGMLTNTRAN